jgi:hypothetical protein
VVLIVVLIATACVAAPPERGSLPDVAEALDPPAQCSFLLGDPQGVLIEDVEADTAADGVLMAGDVIVAIEGRATTDTDDLVDIMEGRSPGDEIEIDYRRDDTEASATIALGSDPGDPERPMIGVLISTRFETVPATDAIDPIDPGPAARPISIGDTIYLLDPLEPAWEKTDVVVPDGTDWVATTDGIYRMQDETLTELIEDVELDLGQLDGWDPVRVIGSVGRDLLLVVTRPVPGDPDQVTVGIARFDPHGPTTVWVEPILAGFGIPVSAIGSPDGENLILVGVNDDGSEVIGVRIWDADGFDTGHEELVTLGAPVGWLDGGTVLFRTEETVAVELDAVSGESGQVMLDTRIAGLPLYPVGDGHNVLVVDGRSLILEDLDSEAEVRTLAENCTFNRMGEPGWGT